MRQTMYKVSRLTLESSFPIESLGFCTDSLWWRWVYITFDSSWSNLKQWVSLNNRRGACPEQRPPQLLVQLSEFVLCCSSSSSTHWHKLVPYRIIWATHFPQTSLKTVIRQNTSSWQLLNNESLLMGFRTKAMHGKGHIKQVVSGKAIMHEEWEVKKKSLPGFIAVKLYHVAV